MSGTGDKGDLFGRQDQPDLFERERDKPSTLAAEPVAGAMAVPTMTAGGGSEGGPPRAPGALPAMPDGDSLPLSLSLSLSPSP